MNATKREKLLKVPLGDDKYVCSDNLEMLGRKRGVE